MATALPHKSDNNYIREKTVNREKYLKKANIKRKTIIKVKNTYINITCTLCLCKDLGYKNGSKVSFRSKKIKPAKFS